MAAADLRAQGQIVYVDDDAPLGGDGATWQTAFQQLQGAFEVAQAGIEIRVAWGIYRPDCDPKTGVHSGDRNATFLVLPGVRVVGGYGGLAAEDPDARDPYSYLTMLTGDLNGDDPPLNDPVAMGTHPNRQENSFHVVTISGTGAELDGLLITGGNAHGLEPINFGAGVLAQAGSARFTDCTFRDNTAFLGAGLYSAFPGSFLERCRFIQNFADNGGGIAVEGASAILTQCLFRKNSAIAGGGLYASAADLSLASCRFLGNDARCETCIGGGAAFALSSATIVNCLFSGNYSGSSGGALKILGPGIKVVNSTFSANYSTGDAHGCTSVNNTDAGGFSAINCIFWGNTGSGGAVEQAQLAVPQGSVNYCCVQGLTGQLGGAFNNGGDPLFTDPLGPDGEPGSEDDNLRLLDPSPAINTASTLALPADSADLDQDGDTKEPVPQDQDGLPRVNSGIVDRGAFEVQRIPFADVGGGFASCLPDGFVNLHDMVHVLACFESTSECETISDAGGSFGDCTADGFCNLFDISHINQAFAGVNPCATGPAPSMEPVTAGSAVLVLVPDRRRAVPGGVIRVDVFLEPDVPLGLQGYQLHIAPDPAAQARGVLLPESITVERRADSAWLAGAGALTAFNAGHGQMLSATGGEQVAIAGRTYLATYTYQVSPESVGHFVIDALHDAVTGGQTYLIAGFHERIVLRGTRPAVVEVAK